MKRIFSIMVLSALFYSAGAHADCVGDQSGNVVCGGGQCVADSSGKIFCAQPGGGAMRDRYAEVQCGVGYCDADYLGKIWCSRKPGGGAKSDAHGKVKCYGGCDAGSPRLCQEAQD